MFGGRREGPRHVQENSFVIWLKQEYKHQRATDTPQPCLQKRLRRIFPNQARPMLHAYFFSYCVLTCFELAESTPVLRQRDMANMQPKTRQ
jgi:hypothetical protein